MSGLGALVKTAKAARKGEPFYSAVDEAAMALTRGKGTGKEFMIEVLKKPGVKPAEIKDRGLQSIEAMPKMTKEQFLDELEKRPPPQVEEKVLVEPTQKDIEARAHEMAYEDAMDELRSEGVNRHDAADEAAEIAEDRMEDYIQQATEELSMSNDAPAHGSLTLDGGENYREMLLKMPSFKGEKKLMELEAQRRRVDPEFHSHRYNELTQQIDALKAEKAAMPPQFKGVSAHFGGEPGILASIRVSDRMLPTYTKQQAQEIGQRIAEGMGVADHKNLGNGAIGVAIKNGYVTPKEAAQYADFRGFKNVDTTGAKQKVLHVEEIQSDWHQQGRKKGYGGRPIAGFKYDLGKNDWVRADDKEATHFGDATGQDDKLWDTREEAARNQSGVPDAPFKKNWHELAMKRVLNYAAENGYDRVAITPGVEQADRYNLAKYIDEISYGKNPDGTYSLAATDKKGKVALNEPRLSEDELESMIGKDMAQKIVSGEGKEFPVGSVSEGKKSLSGLDLEIGGEGMKGFYDKMLPDYLNTYGKKYGVQVSPFDVETKPSEGFHVRDTTNPESRPTRFMSATDAANWRSANNYPDTYVIEPQPAELKQLHGFDITPEMRQEITGKGMPLYQQIGIPTGGAAAGMGALEQEDQGFKKGGQIKKRGRVNVSQNPDTMLLDLLSRS